MSLLLASVQTLTLTSELAVTLTNTKANEMFRLYSRFAIHFNSIAFSVFVVKFDGRVVTCSANLASYKKCFPLRMAINDQEMDHTTSLTMQSPIILLVTQTKTVFWSTLEIGFVVLLDQVPPNSKEVRCTRVRAQHPLVAKVRWQSAIFLFGGATLLLTLAS